jgi:hypothetical protein
VWTTVSITYSWYGISIDGMDILELSRFSIWNIAEQWSILNFSKKLFFGSTKQVNTLLALQKV